MPQRRNRSCLTSRSIVHFAADGGSTPAVRLTGSIEPAVVPKEVIDVRFQRVPIIVTRIFGLTRLFAKLMYVGGVAGNGRTEDRVSFGQIGNRFAADIAIKLRERNTVFVNGDLVTHKIGPILSKSVRHGNWTGIGLKR